jgi:uncharacterized protein (DUF362 family)
MTVLLSDGRRSLAEAFRQILDEQSTGIDWTPGVFLKPNIVFAAKPESGQITSPAFVAAFIRALRERCGDVDIVMGDGVAVGRDPEQNFRASGFSRLSRELDVPLIDLHGAERRPVPWSHGELELPSVALDRVYINLPILKYSSACLVSGALKNQKGLLSPAMKKQFHLRGLHEPIAELNAAVKPSLTVMDGRHFFGPDVLISGDNCGEVDATACRLLGIDEPDHVQLARSAGVFADGFTVQGDDGTITCIAARPEATEAKRIGRLRLWSNAQACTGCRALFQDARSAMLQPRDLAAKWKLLTYSAKGAEILMGSDPQWRKEYRTVICVGSCTHQLAKENGYVYVPGCPPSLDDLYDHL